MSDAPTREHAMHRCASNPMAVSRPGIVSQYGIGYVGAGTYAKVAELGCDICTSSRGSSANATSQMQPFKRKPRLGLTLAWPAGVELNGAPDCTTRPSGFPWTD